MTDQEESKVQPTNQITDQPKDQPIQSTFGKPSLTQLSADVVAHKPELSGECPGKAWLLMLLAALPISLVYGVVGHYVGIAAGYIGGVVALIPNLLTSVCGLISWAFVIFAIIVILGVVFGYPILMGYIDGGFIVLALGKKGLCRSVNAAGFAAAINGIVAYFGHILITFLISMRIQPLTYSISQLESLFDTTIVGIPAWMYIFCGVELILVVVGAVIGARDELKKSTFCEKHQCWYNKWLSSSYAPSINTSLAAAIEANDSNLLESFDRIANDILPRVFLEVRSCPKSQDCEWEMKATLWWQEQTTDKKGQTTTNTNSEQWFDILVPSEFGLQLEEKLAIGKADMAELKNPAGKKGKKKR